MSLRVTAVLICDTCGQERGVEPVTKAGEATIIAQRLRRVAEQSGWKTIHRGRFHTPTHYCPSCQDKPMKPVPRAKVKQS